MPTTFTIKLATCNLSDLNRSKIEGIAMTVNRIAGKLVHTISNSGACVIFNRGDILKFKFDFFLEISGNLETYQYKIK